MNADPFNQLSHAQAERLALLLEELGEAQQAIGKVLRHGYDSYNPMAKRQPSNVQTLERELGDVLAAIQIMASAGDVCMADIRRHAVGKQETVKVWMHHQKDGAR